MAVVKRKATDSPAASDADEERTALEIEQPLDEDLDHGGQRARKRANIVTSESALRHLPLDVIEAFLPLQKQRCLAILVGDLPPVPSIPTVSAQQLAEEQDAAVFTEPSKLRTATHSAATACVGLQDEWHTLHNMLRSTVTSQESNSCLLIGAAGAGKSLLVDSVLSCISQEISPASASKENGATNTVLRSVPPYYHVHLAGTVQINDRAAMKEMAQQLILQGAFTEDDIGDAIDAQKLGEQEEGEDGPRDSATAADHVFGGDGDEDDQDQDQDAALLAANAAADEEAEIQDELAGAILSSLNNIIAHIIALLSNTASTSDPASSNSAGGGRKPLIITLDDFDLFTARPRQAMLYCLLDAVQAASYGAGLAVVGLTSRVDTVDLLEKRVKSRFSHRILHVRPPSSYESFERIVHNALSPLPCPTASSSLAIPLDRHQSFADAWRTDVAGLFTHPHFREVLRGIYELSNDIRMAYRILIPVVAKLSVLDPAFDLEFLLETAAVEVGDGMLHVLRDLTEPEIALLIAIKHLQTRDRQVFNFEMCFDELRRFASRDQRERQAASTSSSLVSTVDNNATPNAAAVVGMTPAEAGVLSGSAVATPFFADRKIALMSFHSLLSLEILLPENYVSTLTISNPVAKPSAAPFASSQTGRANQNTIRKEFWKVRCILTPSSIVQAVKDRQRPVPINSSLVKWASSHG